MTGGSLGIRSGSYGSLQQQALIQQQQQQKQPNGSSFPFAQSTPPRKPSKMPKEKLAQRIFKFAGRRKVGMLFICVISAAVFGCVLTVGKGEYSRDGAEVTPIHRSNLTISSSPTYEGVHLAVNGSLMDSERINGSEFLAPPPPHPPPPTFFLGYSLPPGHPCNSFTLPPPPADRKRTGPRPCPVCYLPVEEAIARMPKFPSPSPVLKNLTYIHEETFSGKGEFGGSDFGGYPTLMQRSDSYNIRESMSVHCGFVKGSKPGLGTGFDIDNFDLLEMEQCNGIVVASAIFGNFDEMQQPKHISEYAKKTACFYMFVDEETESYLRNSSRLDSNKKSGLWRVVVVHNLPYEDARRTGKVPKLLLHRLFPNAQYSLWIDGKLELVRDPYQILERFLWRKNATFAISRHYRRFDVFIEAEANKAAGKYDNASINFQIEFYKKEGLTPYSEAKLPITSDVPEGCVIIREHVPISNLFTCLWFNEVDRFTSRDQISFSTVRDKIAAKTNWTVNMFLDCERRNFVVQKYHREILERRAARAPVAVHPPPTALLPPPPPPPPPPLSHGTKAEASINGPAKRVPTRHGREKRSSRRHRKVSAGNKDMDS